MGSIPPDQGAAAVTATKAVSPLSGAASARGAVNQLLKSTVREIRTLRSVGTGGGRLPPVTRWGSREAFPYPEIDGFRRSTDLR